VEDEGVVNERKGDAEGAGDEEGRVAASCMFFHSRYYLRSARRASGEGAETQERRLRSRSCSGKRARDMLQSCWCMVDTVKYHVPDVAKIERGNKLGREKKQIG
jgi:hypothetical protein